MDLGKKMSLDRIRVPECNRRKFDAEAKEYLAEYESTADPHRKEEISSAWDRRVLFLSGELLCCHAPPCLPRHAEESEEEYMDRCYAAHNQRKD